LILLVRHGKAGDRGRWAGDDRRRPLTGGGRRQAEALVELFRELPVQRVVSSPYLRCVQTVEPLARARGLAVEVEPRLAEGCGLACFLEICAELGPGDLAVCCHGDLTQELVEDLRARRLAPTTEEGLKKAGTWVLELAGGRISAARYIAPP